MDIVVFKKGLQKVLKKSKISYQDIAECWNLSESSVKRIMSTGDFSMERLLLLANLIGIELSELLQSIEGAPTFLTMNATQDALLSGRPDLIYFYVRLTAGDDIDNFSETSGIPLKSCWQMAYALDKVSLIEIHKNNRIKIGNKGPHFFKPDGEVLSKVYPQFFKTMFYHFINSTKMRSPPGEPTDFFARPFELYMSDKSYKNFLVDANNLAMKYRDVAKNDSNAESFDDLQAVAGCILIDQFDSWKKTVAAHPKTQIKK